MKTHAPLQVAADRPTGHSAIVRSTGRLFHFLALTAGILVTPLATCHAAGTLTPKGSSDQPIQIRDHHLEVTLNNGFARSEVTQTFYNPNERDLEAIYSFP